LSYRYDRYQIAVGGKMEGRDATVIVQGIAILFKLHPHQSPITPKSRIQWVEACFEVDIMRKSENRFD
jgi:hypothetical protein